MKRDDNENVYIGWVPCLSGDLFFRYTVPSLADHDVVAINYHARDMCTGEGGPRYVVASSVYEWKDSGNPTQTGWVRVVVCGMRPYKGAFEGSVYFITGFSKKDCKRGLAKEERDLVCSLFDLERQINSALPKIKKGNNTLEKSLARKLDAAVGTEDSVTETELFNIRRAVQCVKNRHVFSVDFVINDSGLARLKYNSDFASAVSTKDEFSSTEKAKYHHHCYVFTRQAFYYLKYLLHRHTHHDHSNDSLTTIHIETEDDHHNARVLIRDLKRGLVDLKRAQKFDKKEVAGIATYGKSLVVSCHSKGYFKSVNSDEAGCLTAQTRYFDNLSESILLRSDDYSPVKAKLRSIITVVHQALAMVFLFITPLLLITLRTHEKKGSVFGVCIPFDSELKNLDYNGVFLNYISCVSEGKIEYLLVTYIAVLFITLLFSLLLQDGIRYTAVFSKLSTYLSSTSRHVFCIHSTSIPYLIVQVQLYLLNQSRLLLREIYRIGEYFIPRRLGYVVLALELICLGYLFYFLVKKGFTLLINEML